jgi:hypothetical protein
LSDDEGNPINGTFEVFVAESDPPPGALRAATTVTRTVLSLRGGKLDLSDPGVFSEYFDRLYANADLDSAMIQRDRAEYKYHTVGRNFKIIADDQATVVVPYLDSQRRVARLKGALEHGMGERSALRNLQPFTVSIFRRQLDRLRAAGALEQIGDMEFFVLTPGHATARYDGRLGLVEMAPADDEGALIV